MPLAIWCCFNGEADLVPPIVDTPNLNRRPLCDGWPQISEPIFEEKCIFHQTFPAGAQKRFVGWERVNLRWMKPDGKGGLVPR